MNREAEDVPIPIHLARRTGRTEINMPADFGEIAAYHHMEAARHYALAQAARERESFGEAEYQAGLAARWDEAAREQAIEMRREPTRRFTNQGLRRWVPEQEHVPSAAACWVAVQRGAQHIATAIHQSLAKRNATSGGLSLR
jgi:hypothetical protein